MRLLDKIRSRGGAFGHDLVMIPVAWLGAYWLRFNLEEIPQPFISQGLAMLPVVVIIQAAVFWYFGLYRGVWRFASVPDLVRIVKAVVTGAAAAAFAIFLLTRMQNIPRAVFPLYGGLLIGLLGAPRLVYRWLKDHRLYAKAGQKALVVGAGRAGEMLVRDMLRDPASPYVPVVFVDDDPQKRGREIHGVRVQGGCDRIPKIVERQEIELVLIALPSATSKQVRRIVEICEGTGVPFRILPRIQDLVTGQASLKQLRDVRIEDLLGREKVTLDWDAITRDLAGRSVMVTGGGGSIGAELCRQVARLKPSKLIVLEQSEFNLYRIDLEIAGDFPQLPLVSMLGDVCDEITLEQAFQEHAPEIVFHAAAYKHVPLLEQQVRPAVLNNIFGTRSVASAAAKHGCGTFVLISSDKAVNPANVMGMTKRIAEMCCQTLAGGARTRFVTVRFGNVLASAGSVIPLFQDQIAAGGPVTVTHPEIMRFFMTIPEACQLILQASIIGSGGEILVLDMGEPVKVSYLAEQLILLSGKKPGEEIEIVYTGLRPGEKLYEELFHDREKLAETVHPKILLARSRPVDREVLEDSLAVLRSACDRGDEGAMKQILRELVPEHLGGANERVDRREGAMIYDLRSAKPQVTER